MVEVSGYRLITKENKTGSGVPKKVAAGAEAMTVSEMKDEVSEHVREMFSSAKQILKQEFNAYSFGLYINEKQQSSIIGDVYNRNLQHQINSLNGELEILQNELKSTRKMTQEFKRNQEQSNKKIAEITLRYESTKEEMAQKQQDAEKRLNSLIRDFVSIYKKLAEEFVNYKDYTV